MKEKKNLKFIQLIQRYGGWAVLGMMLAAGMVIGYLAGNWHVFALQEKVQQLEEFTEDLYERAELFDYQQHIASVELGIEKAATKGLQQELLMAQDENFALRRELAFYQKIMAPELEANGVVIDSFEIQPNIGDNHFHFRLAVVHMERIRKLITGTTDIRLVGRQNGNSVSFDLLELANIETKDRRFSMRYFTVQAGDFVIPEDFWPERIDISLNLSGMNEKLTRSYYWNQLLEPVSTSDK